MPDPNGKGQVVRGVRLEIAVKVRVDGRELSYADLMRQERSFKLAVVKLVRESLHLPTLLSL